MNNQKLLNILFALLAFIIPFSLFYYTHSNSLGFADAAEFALITYLPSIAHGPGFPSYVLLGWLWCSVTKLFIASHFTRIFLFSVASMSAACLLLSLSVSRLLSRAYPKVQNIWHQLIALCCALTFATGFTVWYWSNNVEVYAFHTFTFALLIYGALEYNATRKTSAIIITAAGLAMGLANHHLTTILFIPCLFFFVGPFIFKEKVEVKAGAKPKKAKTVVNEHTIFNFFRSKQFLVFSGTAAAIGLFFYGWMMVRASANLPFKFGSPDTLERFFFHVSGGAWAKKTAEDVEGIFGMRFPYFSWLLARQFSIFLLFIILGFVELYRKKWFRFAWAILLYFFLLQFYQLRLNQIGDSDAYMLLGYFTLAFAIPFGAIWLWQKQKLVLYFMPLLVAGQGIWNFSLADKRNFDLSESLMKTLDESAPKNSVILISDWTLVSEYYYKRIADNFRPDLVVLNYDIKFTNYTILKNMYPEFYNLIQPEYDNYIAQLMRVHPQQVYNTGCDLSTPDLSNAFIKLMQKISSVCKEHQFPLMYDPHAFVFFSQSKYINPNAYVSGCFLSEGKTDSKSNFAALPFKWLDMPVIKHEPGAADKIVDFEAMIDFHKRYATVMHDTAYFQTAERSHQKIIALEQEMKENAPYLFRPTTP